MSGATLAIVVACTTALVMVAARLATLLSSQSGYALDDVTDQERLNARLEAQNALLTQSQEKLTVQNEQLDAALANMVQGLAMFDADERLVLANDRYAELYGLRRAELKPGMTLRQIIELRIDRGLYPGTSADEVLTEMRRPHQDGEAKRSHRQAGQRQRSVIGDPAQIGWRLGRDAA